MKLIINNDKLEIELSKAINSGSINYYNIECEFNNAWDGLIKEIIIKNQKENFGIKRTIVDGIANIDCSLKGMYQIGAKGYRLNYFLTSDTEINTSKIYYTRTEIEGSYIYTKVDNPIKEEISTYYEAEKELQISTGMKQIPVNLGAGEIITDDEEVPSSSELEVFISQIIEVIDKTERLNVTGERVSDGVEIIFTDREGNETIKKVNDGENGEDGEDGEDGASFEYNWDGTSLGVKTSEEEEYQYVNLKGNKGDQGDSGVYVGEEQPTDPNKNVWIDINGTPEEFYNKTETDNLLGLKQNTTDNNLTTNNKNIVSAINEVNSIAKGANQAISYGNYSTMITAFNALDGTEYNSGQNIMIITLEVPDLWISSIEETSVEYTYVDDATVLSDLNTNGYIQCGYYKLSMLETQKVDLTDYIKSTDLATSYKPGLIQVGGYGSAIAGNARIYAIEHSYQQYLDALGTTFVGKTTLENALTGKGLVKVTSISSSSTDDNVVTPKAVYDYIESLNIEEVNF